MSFSSRASTAMILRYGIAESQDYKRCHNCLVVASGSEGVGLGLAAAGISLVVFGDYVAAVSCLFASIAIVPINWFAERRFLAAVQEAMV